MSGVVTGLRWSGRLPERGYDVSLEVAAGRTLALVGPNGAGKSTTLDLVAGLLQAPSARLSIGTDVLVDTAQGVFVPTHRRNIAVLGQDPLLFPHLRVRKNVEFGPRSHGVARREARRRAERLLQEVGADALAERYPAHLSGGQAARVALARALATTPRAVLLDEPFAALDVDAAPQMRRVLGAELRRLGVPAILVSHDLLDVLALADDLAVVENGRIVECAPTAEVLRAPTSAFAASLAGVNHLRGHMSRPGALTGGGGVVIRGVEEAELAPGTRAVGVWSPASVALYATAPDGSPRNVWPGVVRDLTDRGGVVRVILDIGPSAAGAVGGRADHDAAAPGVAAGEASARIGADLSPAAVHDLALAPGSPVVAVVKAQEVRLHPTR